MKAAAETLVKITERDDRLTTLTMESALLLLLQKKDLLVMLEKALEMKSYAEIPRLRTWPSSSSGYCFKSQNDLNQRISELLSSFPQALRTRG
jgi:hypothetical protein